MAGEELEESAATEGSWEDGAASEAGRVAGEAKVKARMPIRVRFARVFMVMIS